MTLLVYLVVQIREKISMPNPEDVLYNETRSMLTSLGLGHYEKNFKKGLLTDNTLPLLTDRQVATMKFFFFLYIFLMIIFHDI